MGTARQLARQSLGFAAQHLAHLAALAIRIARAADLYRRDAWTWTVWLDVSLVE